MGLGVGRAAVKRRSLSRAGAALVVGVGLVLTGACGGGDGGSGGDDLTVAYCSPAGEPPASGSSTDP